MDIDQKVLAKKTGLSVFQLSRFENGWALPSATACLQLAGPLQLTFEELWLAVGYAWLKRQES